MVIGVVGKSHAGKSEVGKILASQGFLVVNLDVLGHQALNALSRDIIASFGPEILTRDGKVDRVTLRDKVFRDKAALHRLENITHPWIERRALEIINETKDRSVALDGAVLHTIGLLSTCRFLIYIQAPLYLRLKRFLTQDKKMRFPEILRLLFIQRYLTLHHFSHLADTYRVRNSGSKKALRAEVLRKIAQGKELSHGF